MSLSCPSGQAGIRQPLYWRISRIVFNILVNRIMLKLNIIQRKSFVRSFSGIIFAPGVGAAKRLNLFQYLYPCSFLQKSPPFIRSFVAWYFIRAFVAIRISFVLSWTSAFHTCIRGHLHFIHGLNSTNRKSIVNLRINYT